jgi:hypothetical protein
LVAGDGHLMVAEPLEAGVDTEPRGWGRRGHPFPIPRSTRTIA